MEATGGFDTIVPAAIGGLTCRWRCHFAQAVRKRAKSDPIDAVIACLAEAVKPEPRELPDKAVLLLTVLVGRQTQLIEMLVAERPAREAGQSWSHSQEPRSPRSRKS